MLRDFFEEAQKEAIEKERERIIRRLELLSLEADAQCEIRESKMPSDFYPVALRFRELKLVIMGEDK